MKSKNVLAENPLDFFLARPAVPAREASEPVSPAPVVAIESAPKRAPVAPTAVVAERAAVAPVQPATVPPATVAAAAVEAATVPSAMNDAPDVPKARVERTTSDVAPRPEPEGEAEISRPRTNRIGTLQDPYLRKRDGLQTRQASVTLPVEVLRKLGHYSVDTGMKTSEIIRQAVEEFLQSRGY